MACKLLHESIRNNLRSGFAISSITQIVEELVLNSIDADANQILVLIDLSDNLKVRVEDNGTGIHRKDFDLIGTRYATSKCATLEDLYNLKRYGYRGEALASVIDICGAVEISSFLRGQEHRGYKRQFSDGLPLGPIKSINGRTSTKGGTTVTVYGLFDKYPVRQQRLNPIEDESIKKVIERIYIINPKIQIDFRRQNHRIIATPSKPSVSEGFSFLYGKHLVEAISSYGSTHFHAWFSLEGHHSKHLQIVYVNQRFINRHRVHKVVNELLSSTLGFKKGGNFVESTEPRASYPIFVINIVTPTVDYDITYEPSKTLIEFKNWELLLEGLKSLEHRFSSLVETMKRSKLAQVVTEKTNGKKVRPLPFDFGKSITTRNLQFALHSRNIKRVGDDAPPSSSSRSETDTNSRTRKDSRDDIDTDESGYIPSALAKSKLSKFRSPPRMKLKPLGSTTTAVTCQTTVAEPIKRLGTLSRGAKRQLPLEKDQNLDKYNKRSRTVNKPEQGNSTLMNKIKEQFPSFRDCLQNDLDKTNPILKKRRPTAVSKVPREKAEGGTISKGKNGRGHSQIIPNMPRDIEDSRLTNQDQGRIDFHDKICQRLTEASKKYCQPKFADVSTNFLIRAFGESDNHECHGATPESLLSLQSMNSMQVVLPSETPEIVSTPTVRTNPSKEPREIVNQILDTALQRELMNNETCNFECLPRNIDEINRHEAQNSNDRRLRQKRSDSSTGIRKLKNGVTTIRSECQITKEELRNLRVIGQADNKFILASGLVGGRETLLLFDQHAVHERIRLERLLAEVQDNGSNVREDCLRIKRVMISPPFVVELNNTELRILSQYGQQFETIGISSLVPINQFGNCRDNSAYVYSAPHCFLTETNNRSGKTQDVQMVSLIRQVIEGQVRRIIETNGNIQPLPEEIFKILCNRACRGAIKFGDPLTKEICVDLISELGKCSAPFQCAHGRPVVTPLLNLSSLETTPNYVQFV